ncbi:AKR_collapsed_G0005630.mRNA.1.CDS.1 [Saccharomyces cerevisiae]|nr:AKR_collapsed_G0005630.mRNA.1.CDS.1 [Saccharomyces cerevisiae]
MTTNDKTRLLMPFPCPAEIAATNNGCGKLSSPFNHHQHLRNCGKDAIIKEAPGSRNSSAARYLRDLSKYTMDQTKDTAVRGEQELSFRLVRIRLF